MAGPRPADAQNFAVAEWNDLIARLQLADECMERPTTDLPNWLLGLRAAVRDVEREGVVV